MAVKVVQKRKSQRRKKSKSHFATKSFWSLVAFLWVYGEVEHLVDVKVWNIYSGLD